MSGNRFGRNKKRAARECIAALNASIKDISLARTADVERAARHLSTIQDQIGTAKYIIETLYKVAPNSILFENAQPIDECYAKARHSNDHFDPSQLWKVGEIKQHEPIVIDPHEIELFQLETEIREYGLNDAIHFVVKLENRTHGPIEYGYSMSAESAFFMREFDLANISHIACKMLIKEMLKNHKVSPLIRKTVQSEAPNKKDFIRN